MTVEPRKTDPRRLGPRDHRLSEPEHLLFRFVLSLTHLFDRQDEFGAFRPVGLVGVHGTWGNPELSRFGCHGGC